MINGMIKTKLIKRGKLTPISLNMAPMKKPENIPQQRAQNIFSRPKNQIDRSFLWWQIHKQNCLSLNFSKIVGPNPSIHW